LWPKGEQGNWLRHVVDFLTSSRDFTESNAANSHQAREKNSCRVCVNKQEIQWTTLVLNQIFFCCIKTARMFNKNIIRNPIVQVKTERSHQYTGSRRIQPEYEKYRMRSTLHSYCIFVTDRKRNLREYFYGFFIKSYKPKRLAFFLSI